MSPPIFSIIKYKKWEYNGIVTDIMKNLETAIGSSDDKIEIARMMAREYITHQAYEHLKSLDWEKFSQGYE